MAVENLPFPIHYPNWFLKFGIARKIIEFLSIFMDWRIWYVIGSSDRRDFCGILSALPGSEGPLGFQKKPAKFDRSIAV